MTLFLGISQSNAVELSEEDRRDLIENFFSDTEGDPTPNEEVPQIILPSANYCNVGEIVRWNLREKYGEVALASGTIVMSVILRGGGVIEKLGELYVYVNFETNAYTLVVEYPEDGVACILGTGQNFGPINRGTPI